jgi:hypothetical protein
MWNEDADATPGFDVLQRRPGRSAIQLWKVDDTGLSVTHMFGSGLMHG